MSAVITGKNYLVTKMDRYNKYQTKQYTHAHLFTLHTQQMVASTLLSDHQGRPSAPTNSLHKLHMVHYQVILTYLLVVINVVGVYSMLVCGNLPVTSVVNVVDVYYLHIVGFVHWRL